MTSASHRRRLTIVFAITALVVVAQAIGAIVTGSLALLADTAHAIVDSVGLFVALIAARLAMRPASVGKTWGYRRIEVLAALGQATLLIIVGTYAAVEGGRRLQAPPEVAGRELLIFGVLGLCANIIGILVLMPGRADNLNMRAAFLEVLNDALGSVGVIVAALVIQFTGFQRADAIAGMFIAALIVPRAVMLMRETLSVLMEFVPKGVDLAAVRGHLLELDHVRDVHDLHVSTIATGLPTLTAHVVVDDECFRSGHSAEILWSVRECVAEHFDVSIQHSTFQIETPDIAASEDPSLIHH